MVTGFVLGSNKFVSLLKLPGRRSYALVLPFLFSTKGSEHEAPFFAFLYNLAFPYFPPLPDMEFVTNITRTYVSRKSFTPKYSVNYDFLGHEENVNLPPMLP